MAIERKYTITCDQCGRQAEGDDHNFDDDWYDLYCGWHNSEGRYGTEEFNLCSDECAAVFDPREHRSHV